MLRQEKNKLLPLSSLALSLTAVSCRPESISMKVLLLGWWD